MRYERADTAEAPDADTPERLACDCPTCGTRLALSRGVSPCPACGTALRAGWNVHREAEVSVPPAVKMPRGRFDADR